MPDMPFPPEADMVLELMGLPRPDVRVPEILRQRDAWNAVLAGSAETAAQVAASVRAVGENYQGESSTKLVALYSAPGGALELMGKAVSAVEYVPRLLTGAASLATGVQVAVISGAIYTSARVLTTMLMGGPAVSLLTMRELARGRIRILRVRREGAEGVHRMFRPALARGSTGRFDEVRRGLPRLNTSRGPGVDRDMPGMTLMSRRNKRNQGESSGNGGSSQNNSSGNGSSGNSGSSGRWWGGSPKHQEGRNSQGGRSNAAPSRPQESLDNSIAQGPNTDRRLARDESTGEFVVFDRTRGDEYHGHQRSWEELDNKQQSVLRRAFGLDKKGRPKN
ncbi:hypothetical protein GCM10022224_072470 [Nonomuraea antimicrobica]|uniref:Uncharacterized protein n=1 Tax=Nonomuraea antimicrobica TaxID=561173 RepID=A0ABP7CY06_9ACTN